MTVASSEEQPINRANAGCCCRSATRPGAIDCERRRFRRAGLDASGKRQENLEIPPLIKFYVVELIGVGEGKRTLV